MSELEADERNRTMASLKTLDSILNVQRDVLSSNSAGLKFGRMAAWGINASMRKGKSLNNYAHKGTARAAKE